MSANVSRKRSHIEGQEDGHAEKLSEIDDSGGLGQREQDERFWFEDGTIILVAGKVEFKVYARPLVEHSPVFKDMLSLPQEEGTFMDASKPPVEALVHLPDSPDDLRYLFEVIMPAKVLRPFGFLQPEIDELVQKSLDFLRQIYPNNIDVYWKPSRSEMAKQMSPIGVVNIARLTNTFYLLPVALMDCCQMDSGLVKGHQRKDGTFERLTDDDLERCLKATGKLTGASVHMTHHLLIPRRRKLPAACPCPSKPTPLTENQWGPVFKAHMPKLCAKCQTALVAQSVALQRQLFLHLPTIMAVKVEGWGAGDSSKPAPSPPPNSDP
ncbi:hypothetical protein K466DRAFT_601699 [Polyporus arcularius HHB13444]|uniref:BTB domain-containing protein n=1 Tax=Polyporus arcularius HHB13444 TaxID=1314778 RepID=A0A5C3P7E2_9APHY|nr:hypothetical protein K466DRAFT_601699 [Polyporus arcularius HHB13444]